jgi:predicted glycogen debranching enzyme
MLRLRKGASPVREWIVTNGLGSYASLTHSHEVTSKFHGLLVASLEPPTKRWMFVSNIADRIHLDNRVYSRLDMKGTFSFDFFPSLTYTAKGVSIKKTFFMDYGKNTTFIKYAIQTDKPLTVTHIPTINSRHFYDTTSPGHVAFTQHEIPHGIIIYPSNINRKLTILLSDAQYTPDGYWEELYYKKDRDRRDAWRDHNFHIGEFEKNIARSTEYYLTLTVEPEHEHDPVAAYQRELKRKQGLLALAQLPKEYEKLVLAADTFVVRKGTEKSIVAGYHWFSDWGRDTLISLPGITLVTKRFSDARQILLSYGKFCKKGLIPNVFGERNAQPVYNTVDAALWFIDRVYQYLTYTNDLALVEALWPVLQSIIEGYTHGTEYGIHMDSDFLISHGPGLTWMDVKIGEYYPTPRSKKAVEIQALWYNDLMIMGTLARLLKKHDHYSELAASVKQSFQKLYDQQYDVVDARDLSMRPNQIFLASLDFLMIDHQLQEKIVDDVLSQLVTVFGLRTLSSQDSRYKGTYFGDYNKDLAYHNGTVWPWLLGPFIKAFVRMKNQELAWRQYAYTHFLQPMFDVFGEKWDGSVYEIFDADPPFAPQGCITQAWSVAEILRAWVEDVEGIQPPYKNLVLHEVRV